MIKKVTSREFSRYFSQYRVSDIDVTSNGKIVGHWRVSDSKVSDTEFKVPEAKVELLKDKTVKPLTPKKKKEVFKSFFKNDIGQGIDNL